MNSTGVDDEMVLISQYYQAGTFSQFVPDEQVVAENPKVRRRRKKNKVGEDGMMRKRKLSEEQVNMLEQNFGSEHKLESERKDKLAAELGLDPRQVAVWFQNRRARWKTKKLEEEYSKLKSEHDNTIVEKCRIENELMKLKGQLIEAEEEIKKLSSERWDGFSSNSPSSSLVSMEAMHPPFLGEFGMEGLENVLYEPQNCYGYGMEMEMEMEMGWDKLYYM